MPTCSETPLCCAFPFPYPLFLCLSFFPFIFSLFWGQVTSGAGMYSTMGPLVKRRGLRGPASGAPTGFLTTTKIFDGIAAAGDLVGNPVYHPQTPLLGTGVEVGVVEDAITAVNDDEWFEAFVCEEPGAQVGHSCCLRGSGFRVWSLGLRV